MSGHSKWSTIKRQKESSDAKRGMLFSKLTRAIGIAARDGTNPETNFKLRLIIDKAKTANMPNENIERALRAAQEKSVQVEKIIYEGFGPGGIAVIVEAVTDSKNRTAQEIKNLFERVGGRLAGPGSVSFQFESAGYLLVEKSVDSEGQILSLNDAGAEDVEESTDGIDVYVAPTQTAQLRDKIERLGFKIQEMKLTMRPKTFVQITDSNLAQKALAFLEMLQSHEDVQEVFSNIDIIS